LESFNFQTLWEIQDALQLCEVHNKRNLSLLTFESFLFKNSFYKQKYSSNLLLLINISFGLSYMFYFRNKIYFISPISDKTWHFFYSFGHMFFPEGTQFIKKQSCGLKNSNQVNYLKLIICWLEKQVKKNWLFMWLTIKRRLKGWDFSIFPDIAP